MIANALAWVRTVVVIPPMILDSDVTVISEVFDLQGVEVAEFLTTGGGWQSPAAAAVVVEHGDLPDGSDMVPVPDSLLYYVEANATVAAANTVGRVGYRIATGKRYVRLALTVTGSVSSLRPGLPPVIGSGNVAVITSAHVVGAMADGGIIDTNGYTFVSFNLAIDYSTGTAWDSVVTVRHSDNSNFSGAADVPDSLLDAAESTLSWDESTVNAVRRIGYYPTRSGGKRYVRLRFEFTGDWDGDGTVVGGCAHLYKMPLESSYEIVGLFRGLRTVPE